MSDIERFFTDDLRDDAAGLRKLGWTFRDGVGWVNPDGVPWYWPGSGWPSIDVTTALARG